MEEKMRAVTEIRVKVVCCRQVGHKSWCGAKNKLKQLAVVSKISGLCISL